MTSPEQRAPTTPEPEAARALLRFVCVQCNRASYEVKVAPLPEDLDRDAPDLTDWVGWPEVVFQSLMFHSDHEGHRLEVEVDGITLYR